jgi:hypothetical protein
MSVLYESSPSDFESQYGSPHGFHDLSAGHSSDEFVDRSRPSTSPFFPKLEFPPGGYPMSFNMSGSSYSDPENIDWNSLELGDGISTTSPMSNEPYEQDHLMLYSNSVSQAMHAINITASQRQPHTESFSFDFTQQQFPTRQFYESKATAFLCPFWHIYLLLVSAPLWPCCIWIWNPVQQWLVPGIS